MAKVTLSTLAETTGLTPSGVSKALSAHPDMSEETIRRVRRLADQLNYRPAYFGKALRTGKSQIFALAGYEPGGVSQRAYMPGLYDAVMRECHQRGYDLTMFDPLDTWPNDREAVPRIIARGLVDGILLLAAEPSNPLLKSLQMRSIPFVVMDDLHATPHNAIVVDLESAGSQAVEHLRECGARQIVYLESLSERVFGIWANMDRGLQRACKRVKIPFLKHEMALSWFGKDGITNIRRHLKQWLSQSGVFKQSPIGVVAGNDSIAQSLLSVALELRIEVPAQLKVIGYSNDMFCQQAYPPLTSIGYQETMAAEGLRMLCQLVEKRSKRQLPSCKLTPQLIVRASTAGTF
jgi:LacI family transcriptional regulator